jgi:hypothetical protein
VRASPVAPDSNPEWLTTPIRTLEAQPVANPPPSITRYEQGEVVHFAVAVLDIWSDLYALTYRSLSSERRLQRQR